MTKMESVRQLRQHLSGMFDSRHRGARTTDYALTQGYIDGYMQAMTDLGVLSDGDLLKIVAEERTLAAERADKPQRGFVAGLVENFA